MSLARITYMYWSFKAHFRFLLQCKIITHQARAWWRMSSWRGTVLKSDWIRWELATRNLHRLFFSRMINRLGKTTVYKPLPPRPDSQCLAHPWLCNISTYDAQTQKRWPWKLKEINLTNDTLWVSYLFVFLTVFLKNNQNYRLQLSVAITFESE
jgi:hypothetical protein